MQHEHRYDVAQITFDARVRGWLPIDLIREAKVSITHGYKFLRGEVLSPRIAERFTKALGKPDGHYLIRADGTKAADAADASGQAVAS